MRGVAYALAALVLVGCAGPVDPLDHVDPFIGTGGHGHTYPGATVPFGMVQLSPDTRLTGWDGCSGYHDSDDVIYGFSHTHLSGTGVSDYGDILLMPTVGEPTLLNGAVDGPESGYASRFAKSNERASAGYYAVALDEGPIEVELTASERTGLHRDRYPRGEAAHVVVDLAHRDRVTDSALRRVGTHEIEGWRHSTGWARDQRLWFVARFSEPIESFRLESRVGGAVVDKAPGPLKPLPEDAQEAQGDDIRALLGFGALEAPLTVHVGISMVDLDGARRNLEAETAAMSFDEVHAAARARWAESLGRVTLEGGSAAERTNFYTALYHSLIAPNVASDVDGRYRGTDREIQLAEGRRHYTVFSLWDTFRATHPLYTILERERTREFIESFLAIYREGGRLPVWELAGNETDTMIGYHAIPVIVDAWVKGIRDYDAEAALDAMVHSATLDHHGLAAYRANGFISAEDDAESVSKTLEYAYDDFCIARFAADLGRAELEAEYDRRSQGWRHLLDPQSGFMRARHNQRWLESFDPRRVDLNYTEANAWQYSLFVPHDNEALITSLGGDEAFIVRLDDLFSAPSETTGRDQADITGLIGQYAHGNEPSHHMAWLYHYAGRPDKSIERVQQILDELYTPTPDGLSGNEDCGQMSSWYAFAAMGLYPVTPCTPQYTIGRPLFDRVALQLENGASFEIVRQGRGAYVTAASLNGAPIGRAFLNHDEILAGGRLELTLGSTPSGWGREERPPSRIESPAILPAPYVVSEADRFAESLRVELHAANGAALEYAFGDAELQPYDGAFELEQSRTIRFRATDGERTSPIVSSYLHRLPNRWRVENRHEPNSQYTAGGDDALVDGLRGAANWKMGGWHGYQMSDFEVTVDLGESTRVSEVGASFLQDQRSWIWMPTELNVSLSSDGESYRLVATVGHDVADDADGIVLGDLRTKIEPETARYVRFHAVNYGEIPRWHLGYRGRAFIFVDELFVQ